MNQAQRKTIENVIKRAERGPSLGMMRGLPLFGPEVDAADEAARIWAQSWVADALRAVLENEDGELSAARLRSEWAEGPA